MKIKLLPLVAGFCLAVLTESAPAQTTGSALRPEFLHGFTAGITDFYNGVIVGPGGDFFGVSRLGGQFNNGAFFKVDGSGIVTKLADFGDPNSTAPGRHPTGRLVYDGSTYFYGVTADGGLTNNGTVFRVDAAGTVETLVQFTGHEGVAPVSYTQFGLTAGQDGNFYGVGDGGVLSGDGIIYRISPTGRFEVLVEFTKEKGVAPGGGPSSPLLAMPDGSFVGTTSYGGRLDRGVVYRFSPQTGYTFAGEFTGDSGALPGSYPRGELVRGLDGSVYGYVYHGPDNTHRIWKLPPSGSAQPFVTLKTDVNGKTLDVYTQFLGVLASGDLVTFADNVEAYSYNRGLLRITPTALIYPYEDLTSLGYAFSNFSFGSSSALVDDGAGGFLASFGSQILRRPPSGPTVLLASITPDAGTGEGLGALGNVLIAADGTVFGTTARGGTNDQGTVFKLPTTGPLNTLLQVQNSNGYYFYYDEVTYSGDNLSSLVFSGSDLLHVEPYDGMSGSGIVQRITPGGTVSIVADFNTVAALPANISLSYPRNGLTADGLGNFYGRAQYYDSVASTYQEGIYRLTSGNQLEFVGVVPMFAGSNYSAGAFTFDAFGNFYGVQPYGGNKFQGLIYKVTPAGQITKFFEFGQTGDPTKTGGPNAPFLREPSGSFIVPTNGADDDDSVSSLIRLPLSGPPSRILGFSGQDGPALGRSPIAPLVRDASGRIYGVTTAGGTEDLGVLYRVEANGAYTLLHQFTLGDAVTDLGTRPSTGLMLSPDGTTIYGGTFSGGPNGGGTLFRFPIAVQASATTNAATDVTANSATYHATLDSNGYGGSFFFRFGESAGNLDQQTSTQTFGGFNGSQDFDLALGALKGHRTYYVQFNSTVGAGPDTITRQGNMVSFVTPNGAPRPADDTIIVTATTGGFAGEVLANDIEPDDDALAIDSYGQGTYGAVTKVGDTLVYTPTQAFFDNGGRDSFTYTVRDDQTPALSASATVEVLSDTSIVGDYAGLLFDETPGASAIPRDAAAIPSPDQIAAGFATFALAKGRKFSARFQVGTRSVAIKGVMSEGRGTRVTRSRDGFDSDIRPTAGGVEGRITFNGRTLILRMGQAFEAAQGVPRPVSSFTMRFQPDTVAAPVNSPGVPAGSGFAIVRELKRSRALLVGVLPDGTAFTKGSVINGDKRMDFFTPLYKDKSGSLGGKLAFADNGDIDGDAGTSTAWKKAAQPRDTRFARGFSTTLTPFGGKYTLPAKGQPPITVPVGKALLATFDRGGLFAPLSTKFTFAGAKPMSDPITDSARAKAKFDARAGLVTGSFIPTRKSVKYRGLIVQRDQQAAGFFLGTADTGSVVMTVVP